MFESSMPDLSRRSFLIGGASLTVSSFIPSIGHASGARDPRFLAIILRGALDGLAAVAPVGDPQWSRLRRETLLSASGPNPTLSLDNFFGLNPRLNNFHRLYGQGEAAVIHAVATPFRGRSHFDGQDLLESGHAGVGNTDSGWLNRAIGGLGQAQKIRSEALAVGPVVPLIMRGSAPVMTWGPRDLDDISADTLARLMALYSDKDPALLASINSLIAGSKESAGTASAALWQDSTGLERQFVKAAEGAGNLMAKDDGPRIAALAYEGWDTHANEGPVDGRLGKLLGALDMAFAALEQVMKPVWRDTAVLVMTEFGRTVAENGTDGTDHGTGTVAFLIGGAVKGGRVYADWPGLSQNALFEGRDLKPTTDLRAVAKGILGEHLGIDRKFLDASVFPDSGTADMIRNLIRTG